MKKEEQLYLLIDSLAPVEKKYIRLNINKFRPNAPNKNLLLFDTLNKQKKYEEGQSEAAYEKEGYTNQYLAADRNLLYDLVLDSLSEFHQKNTAAIKASKGYQNALILFEEKLYQQAIKQIERVEKEAIRFEFFGLLIELNQLKQRIYKVIGKLDAAINCIANQQKYWEAQQEINSYLQLHYQSAKLRISIGKARTKNNLQKINDFMDTPLLKDGCKSLHFQAKFHYLETYCNYYFITNDKRNELESNQKLGEHLKKFDWFDKNDPLNYLAIQTRIFALQRVYEPDNFFKNLAKYRALEGSFSKQKEQAQATIFIFSHNYELDYYLANKNWADGLETANRMNKGLKKHSKLISDALLITAHYRIACIYFHNQQYDDALLELDTIQDNFNPAIRPDVYSFTLLLKILAHYELGNKRLLPYLIKTSEYYIKTRGMLFLTEKLIIKYAKKIANANNVAREKEVLQELLQAINETIQQNDKEKLSLEIFDFIAWLEVKIAIF